MVPLLPTATPWVESAKEMALSWGPPPVCWDQPPPPFVLFQIEPLSPTSQASEEVGKLTPLKAPPIEVELKTQVPPPLVVYITVPSVPTAIPFEESKKSTP